MRRTMSVLPGARNGGTLRNRDRGTSRRPDSLWGHTALCGLMRRDERRLMRIPGHFRSVRSSPLYRWLGNLSLIV